MNDEGKGNLIFTLRKQKNISQEELASALDVSIMAVSKWERGVCSPRKSKMKLLAEILGVSIKELENGKLKEKKQFNYIYIVIIVLSVLCIFLFCLLGYKNKYYYKLYSINNFSYVGSGFIFAKKDYEELYIHSLSLINSDIKGYDFQYTIFFDDVTLLKFGNIENYVYNKKDELKSLSEYVEKLNVYYKSDFSSFLNERISSLEEYNIRINIEYIDEKFEIKNYDLIFNIFEH